MYYLYAMSLGILSYFHFNLLFCLVPILFGCFFNKRYVYMLILFIIGFCLIFFKSKLQNTKMLHKIHTISTNCKKHLIVSGKIFSVRKSNLNYAYEIQNGSINNVNGNIIVYSRNFYNIGKQISVSVKRKKTFGDNYLMYLFFKEILLVGKEIKNNDFDQSAYNRDHSAYKYQNHTKGNYKNGYEDNHKGNRNANYQLQDSYSNSYNNSYKCKDCFKYHGGNKYDKFNNTLQDKNNNCNEYNNENSKSNDMLHDARNHRNQSDNVSGANSANNVEQQNCVSSNKVNTNAINTNKSNSKINNLRFFIHKKFTKHFGYQKGSILSLMTTGLRDNVSEIYKLFSNAGISHILAISGLHISILVVLLFLFLRRFLMYLSPMNATQISGSASIIITFLYILFSGATISGIRALIMNFVAIIGVIKNKRAENSLEIAGIIILFLWPESVINAGFVLSFISVLILTLISANGNFLKKSFYTSLYISLIIIPYTVYFFNSFSLYGIINNVMILPIISFVIMPLAIVNIFIWLSGVNFCFTYLINKSLDLLIYISKIFNGNVDGFEISGFGILLITLCLIFLSVYNFKKQKLIADSIEELNKIKKDNIFKRFLFISACVALICFNIAFIKKKPKENIIITNSNIKINGINLQKTDKILNLGWKISSYGIVKTINNNTIKVENNVVSINNKVVQPPIKGLICIKIYNASIERTYSYSNKYWSKFY